MSLIRDEQTIKVHMGQDDYVWYADGDQTPLSSGLGIQGFIESLATRKPVFIRAIGTARNAMLIATLYRYYGHPAMAAGQVEVASPQACETQAELDNPEIALYRMRQFAISPSLGGWHVMNEADFPAYVLAAAMEQDGLTGYRSSQILSVHPAWHDLSFLGGIRPQWAACVLGFIIDPRWYVDPVHPERLSRLRYYMGLVPRVMRDVAAGKLSTPKAIRCRAVLHTWKQAEPPTAADRERPEFFLWRRYQAAGGGVKGDLRASESFIAYLVHTWRQAIASRSKSGQRLDMFQPDMILQQHEIAAYKRHAAGRPQPV